MRIYFVISTGAPDLSVRVLKSCGVDHILLSYVIVGGKADISLPFNNIILDSGAFSVKTGVEKVSVRAYALWLELYLSKYPQIRAYVNLDDIDNPENSHKNQEYLESCGLSPMPVYHYKEPVEWLDRMCKKYEYIGLGGIVTSGMKSEDLKRFWEWVYERYPGNRFHLFGVTAMPVIVKYQPYSIDSSAWTVSTKFRRIAGYHHGMPAYHSMPGHKDGWQLFFKTEEFWANNIRAMLDWEKLEWLKHVKGSKTNTAQQKMF